MEQLKATIAVVILLGLSEAAIAAVARTTDTCEGGRGVGDKWFDGCRWCVCQSQGPGRTPFTHCSSSECSELNAKLPPCKNYGSWWVDGCYLCKCHPGGIECVAHQVCVYNLAYPRGGRWSKARLISQGACVKPQDDRCVCGLDGVPSCTADAIDRNAIEVKTEVKTITLKEPSISESTFETSLLEAASRILHEKARDVKVAKSQGGRVGGRQSSSLRQTKQSKGRRPPYMSVANRWKSRGTSRPRKIKISRNSSRRRNQSRALKKVRQNNSISPMVYATPEPQDDLNEVISFSGDGTDKSVLKRLIRSFRNSHAKEISSRDLAEDVEITQYQKMQADAPSVDLKPPSGQPSYPPSLLVTADNRCRWGARWYGGGLRCYCDAQGAVTCGDPNFVAPKIDGFFADGSECQEGEAPKERPPCQECECQVDGVVLCGRSDACPLPFLVTPIGSETSREDVVEEEIERSIVNEDEEAEDTMAEFEERNLAVDLSLLSADDGRDLENDDEFEEADVGYLTNVKVVECTPGKKWNDGCRFCVCNSQGKKKCDNSGCYEATTKRLPPTKVTTSTTTAAPTSSTTEATTKITTTATTAPLECKPKDHWMDGCLQCECTLAGKKVCDDRRCLKAPTLPPKQTAPPVETAPENIVKTGPHRTFLQLPDEWSSGRTSPVKPAYKKPITHCGKFKVGEKYWDGCNLCTCTQAGAKCTAMGCR